jgi:hypothetical protein
MTVYAADWRQHALVGRITAGWSHLAAGPGGDLGKLHAFAARIGLSCWWLHDKPWPRAHCDVPNSKRRQAVDAAWRAAAGGGAR